ncbi:phosphatase PAP2 family protein [Leptolinea tardivitalis]|uniref:Inositolphosphotransferase Aur1/Ipt1 domain-containing protein n=1 Tax=Leptolinea tardivitalis TaxID=229920 RepID=A0A0P6X2B0_9CHLR|nr:phosphatase PAP2 family protein [Leptolinea tardivitalis]KPL73507.1 hypothetical protein ADM99_04860 [Leptolinea tardivitalis]GAP21690.1 PAP2 superfamily [Leptolinea tardivitalis]
MTQKKRLLLFGLILLAQAIYLPLNRGLQNGTALNLPIDNLIPIYPVWAVPYVLWMVSWFALWLWAAFKMPEKLYRQMIISGLVTIVSAMIFFLLVPTYVPRKPVDEMAFGAIFLQLLYSADGLYCAFPSGHIYLCALTGYFFSNWFPKTRWLWAGILMIVGLSTLFTGQHYVTDLLGGLIFAGFGILMGRRLMTIKSLSRKLTNW